MSSPVEFTYNDCRYELEELNDFDVNHPPPEYAVQVWVAFVHTGERSRLNLGWVWRIRASSRDRFHHSNDHLTRFDSVEEAVIDMDLSRQYHSMRKDNFAQVRGELREMLNVALYF